jgi:hypothetical protein
LPHESKFSSAFAEFAAGRLPERLHAAVVQATQNQRLIGHIARDSTAIPARERCGEGAEAGRQEAQTKTAQRLPRQSQSQ